MESHERRQSESQPMISQISQPKYVDAIPTENQHPNIEKFGINDDLKNDKPKPRPKSSYAGKPSRRANKGQRFVLKPNKQLTTVTNFNHS